MSDRGKASGLLMSRLSWKEESLVKGLDVISQLQLLVLLFLIEQ